MHVPFSLVTWPLHTLQVLFTLQGLLARKTKISQLESPSEIPTTYFPCCQGFWGGAPETALRQDLDFVYNMTTTPKKEEVIDVEKEQTTAGASTSLPPLCVPKPDHMVDWHDVRSHPESEEELQSMMQTHRIWAPRHTTIEGPEVMKTYYIMLEREELQGWRTTCRNDIKLSDWKAAESQPHPCVPTPTSF